MKHTCVDNRTLLNFNLFVDMRTESCMRVFKSSSDSLDSLSLVLAEPQDINSTATFKPTEHSPTLRLLSDRQEQITGLQNTAFNTDINNYPTREYHVAFDQIWRHVRAGFKAGMIVGATWGFVFDVVLFVLPGTDDATMSTPAFDWIAATLEGALAFGLLGALMGAIVSLTRSRQAFIAPLRSIWTARTSPASSFADQPE